MLILKTKKWEVLTSYYQNELLTLDMFPNNKTKTKTEGWHKREKSFKLNNRNELRFLFSCIFIFHQINLLNIHNCDTDSFSFIILKGYIILVLSQILQILWGLWRLPLIEPINGLTVHSDPWLHFISVFDQKDDFY